jgi:hypothetical protein
VFLQSKPLAFLIENSSNKNSFQLADNKQKRSVLIENFEPNRARVFVPRRVPQIAPAAVAQPQFAAFLTGSCSQTEFAVTLSKQTAEGFLTGSRIACLTARSAFLSGTAQHIEIVVTHSKQRTEEILSGARIAFLGLQTMWLMGPSLHLTICRLNGLQLFRSAGVCNKRDMQEIPARADNVRVTHSEASFVVE